MLSDQGPPIAHPSVVLEFAVVGFDEVLHAIPLTVTVAPPFEETVPPLTAVVCPMLETALVVTIGTPMAVQEFETMLHVPFEQE